MLSAGNHQEKQSGRSNNLQSASNGQAESRPSEKLTRGHLTPIESTHQHLTYAELTLTLKCHQPCSNCTLRCTEVELTSFRNVESST